MAKYKFFVVILLFFLLFNPDNCFPDQNDVYIAKISSSINPGVADYIKEVIQKAYEDNASCIIIELDTPGGLAQSMRDIIIAMLGSKLPIVVYVSPSGARAASAGVMITMAAHIAAMAPGTNIGAAHPVSVGGKEIGGTISDKAINDMVAHAKSIAEKRGRNAAWVEKAIRESVAITETEALEKNVIDIIAQDIDDLINKINNRSIEDTWILKLNNANKIILKESLRIKILKTISDPNIAYILMMIGLAGLYFELSQPGAIAPGVIGVISLILAFFSFQTLPVNYAGFLLIIISVILFIMEMKITSYGLLSIAGIASLILGSFMLFDNSAPGLRLSWTVFVPTVFIVSAFFVGVAGIVFKAQVAQPKTGSKGLIGEIGVTKTEIKPEGKVLVHGELWNATSKYMMEQGEKVRVVKVVGLVLEVSPID